jgi:hypothetical protein
VRVCGDNPDELCRTRRVASIGVTDAAGEEPLISARTFHGVAPMHELKLGQVGSGILVHVTCLTVMGLAGALFAARRVEQLLPT